MTDYKGEDIEIGDYLIDDVVIGQLGGFHIEKQLISHNGILSSFFIKLIILFLSK